MPVTAGKETVDCRDFARRDKDMSVWSSPTDLLAFIRVPAGEAAVLTVEQLRRLHGVIGRQLRALDRAASKAAKSRPEFVQGPPIE